MPDSLYLQDHQRDARLVRRRMLAGAVAIGLLTLMLIGRMYYLQVIQYEHHSTLSESNRVHVQPIPPNRGLIYDRNGVILAENRPSFSLTVTRERAKDWQAELDRVVEILGLGESERALFEKRVRQGRRPFEPVPIMFELSEEQIARIAVNQFQLPGVEVTAQLVRHYPQQEHFAHSVGYVGRINEQELKRSIRSTTAVPTTWARPAWSASTRTTCTARSATRKSRPTPGAGCCGCSSARHRCLAKIWC